MVDWVGGGSPHETHDLIPPRGSGKFHERYESNVISEGGCPRPKLFELMRTGIIRGEGGQRNRSCREFEELSNSGDTPGGGETKSVGNFMKRKDRTLKFFYGAGKCPKRGENKK